jgi:hypothetical protein
MPKRVSNTNVTDVQFQHPAINGGVVYRDTTFFKLFSQFAIADPIFTVPTDCLEDNLGRKMTPFEISHTTPLTEVIILDCQRFKTLQQSPENTKLNPM